MKIVFTVVFIVLILTGVQSQEKKSHFEVNGYAKYLQTLLVVDGFDTYLVDNLIHNRFNFRYKASDHFNIDIDFRNRIFYGDQVKTNPFLPVLIEEANNDYFDLSYHIVENDDWLFNTTIDRAYVEYFADDFEIRVGRQRINWGIGTIWNPNDIFNAFNFTDFDYEERPGTDGVRVKYHLDFASSIEIAAKFSESGNEHVIGGLYKWNQNQFDFQVLAGYSNNDVVIGGGWAGNLKDAGVKGEVSYFHSTLDDEDPSFSGTVSIDYSFDSGLFASVGYLFNSNGRSEGSTAELFNFELSAKNLYPFKHAIAANVGYPISALVNSSITLVYSPVSSKALFISPNITVSIANNWDLNIIGQLVYNQENGEYINPVAAASLRLKFSF